MDDRLQWPLWIAWEPRRRGPAHRTVGRALHAQRVLGRLVVGELGLCVQPSLGGFEVGALDFARHMPYGPDQAQREAETGQKMGGDGVGDVQDLVNGEVVQVAVEVLDAVGGPFGGGS